MTELSTETGEYWELTLVCDGALDGTYECTTYDEILDVEDDLQRQYQNGSFYGTWELFSVYHPHAITDEDCECSQYETDHRPIFVLEWSKM